MKEWIVIVTDEEKEVKYNIHASSRDSAIKRAKNAHYATYEKNPIKTRIEREVR